MATPGSFEAVMKLPPGAADGTGANRPFSSAVGPTGLAVTAVTTLTATDPATIPNPFGCYVTWISDTDCYVRVGTSTMNVATTSDQFLPAGVSTEWWHRGGIDTHFSVIQKTAAGTIKRYRSSQ
jgi:hypothetical protein